MNPQHLLSNLPSLTHDLLSRSHTSVLRQAAALVYEKKSQLNQERIVVHFRKGIA